MPRTANVRSLEAIREFKVALAVFEEEATAALETMQTEIYRAIDWLENDRPSFWQQQVRHGFDDVAEARTALETCRMRIVAGRKPSCIEEKQALRAAKHRLENAQEKIDVVRHWCINVRHETDEFKGRIGQLQRYLETDVPRLLATLQRMINALEGYVSIQTPNLQSTVEPSPAPATTDETVAHNSPNSES